MSKTKISPPPSAIGVLAWSSFYGIATGPELEAKWVAVSEEERAKWTKVDIASADYFFQGIPDEIAQPLMKNLAENPNPRCECIPCQWVKTMLHCKAKVAMERLAADLDAKEKFQTKARKN